jgi:hypothetical protein
MKILTASAALLVSLLAGCASQAPLTKETASGKAEGSFPEGSVTEVNAKLTEDCYARGGSVVDSTQNYIVCQNDMPAASAVLVQMTLGNSYSTQPVTKTRYSFFEKGEGVKAIADSWVETIMPGGQVRAMPINNNGVRNAHQSRFTKLGAF